MRTTQFKRTWEQSEPGHGYGPEFELMLESVDREFDEWSDSELNYLEEAPNEFNVKQRKIDNHEST